MAADDYTLGGNTFFLVVFSLIIPFHVFFGIKYKTWGFSFGMLSGLIMEVLGYISRVVMSQGNTAKNYYIMYIVCLTIGPAFISASVYLSLARIITVYGQRFSYFKPRTITLTFILGDVFALLLQSGGGGLATSDDPDTADTGVTVLKAGLAIHLAAIAIFLGLSAQIAFMAKKHKADRNPNFLDLQSNTRFKAFICTLGVATTVILIRTAYRVAEFEAGLGSDLAKDETLFFVLEGTMITIATLGLTVFHPGPSFQGRWAEANFHFKTKKDNKFVEKDNGSQDSELRSRIAHMV